VHARTLGHLSNRTQRETSAEEDAMGPDPQFGPMIDYLKSMPSMADIPIAMLRQAPKPVNPNPTKVDEVSDRTIPGPEGDIPVRIYRSGAAGALPLVVFYHGGGFVVGDVNSHDEMARVLTANIKCVTVSVDYRLAPEHPFPAAPNDCFAALKWAAANARELGADASRIFVIGDSAGGNLSAMAALRARDERGPALKGQVLIYPVTEFGAPFGPGPDGQFYVLTPKDRAFFNKSYLKDEAAMAAASPALAKNFAGLAPALVITAEYDPLCPQGEAYAEKLKAAGVETKLSRYAGAVHGFASFPVPMGLEALQQASEWVRTKAA
jgi:acetyl esterase